MDPSDLQQQADLAGMRVRYTPGPLHEHEAAGSPFVQFRDWLAAAVAAGLVEPNAFVLATEGDGRPSSRLVLLKELDERGFVFYTNTGSRKAREIAANPSVSACFPWFAMARQVVLQGQAEPIEPEAAEAYWRTRPRESQLGAWASDQSRPIADRATLHARLAEVQERFAEGDDVPIPPRWGGYRIVPGEVEFWQGQPGRLHDRLCYRRSADGWVRERLQP